MLHLVKSSGEITDVRMVGRGKTNSKLPVVTSITTATGSGAKLGGSASNSGVGGVASFEITNSRF